MREMKDSGIEWIGKIPKGWKVPKIKYVAKFLNGDRGKNYPSGNDLTDSGIVFLTSNNIRGVVLDCTSDITKYITEKRYNILGGAKIRKNDIIFCLRGSVGNCAINKTENEGTIASSLVDIRPIKVVASFLNYCLKSDINSIQTSINMNGSCAANLSAENVANYCFIEPSISEQQQIADCLDTKCSEINATAEDIQKEISLLEDYKKSVITEAVTKGLNTDAEMKDSGIEWIGEIPKDWKVKRLKYLYDYTGGSPVRVGPFGSELNSKEYQSEGIWVYNQRTVLDENFISNDVFITEEKAKKLSAFTVKTNDILITTRGTIGKIAIVPNCAEPGIIHPCIIRFRINSKLILSRYVKYIFNDTDITMNQIFYKSNGSTIEVLYSYSLRDILLPLPSINQQINIIDFLDTKCSEIDSLIADKKRQLDILADYKKSLIYEYVTGKKEVPVNE